MKDNDRECQSNNHQNEETDKEQHLCQVCGCVFSSRKSLQKHTVGLSNNSANTRCHICNQQFCNSEKLKQHLWTHTDLMYECRICKVKIKHFRNYKRHINSHDEKCSKIICDLCSMSFKSQYNFQRHMKNIHKL